MGKTPTSSPEDLLSARIERLRNVRDDRGSISIETMMIVAGLVVVAAIAAGVILTKVNEKSKEIK
jgi:Archaeal flagellins